MDSTIFKHQPHYQEQKQHHQPFNGRSNNNNNNKNNIISRVSNHNNNNQNSIFILNTATNNIFPNNPSLYYSDLNDNNAVSSSASSSVWSSASSTMCSPAAHAIQKLFSCSSNSLKFNHGNYSGIETKRFKSNSEILKKKSKFWKYLEAEANEQNNQRGIDDANEKKMLVAKSFKYKTKYWSKSYESDNQNQQDLSELLEYSCSLCDNCRCMDCQIGYFDCENSDDSNSEYSFHLSAYEEDEEANESGNEVVTERPMELKSYENCCYRIEKKQHAIQKLARDSKLPTNCNMVYCMCQEGNCTQAQCCQQCVIESIEKDRREEVQNQQAFLTTPDH